MERFWCHRSVPLRRLNHGELIVKVFHVGCEITAAVNPLSAPSFKGLHMSHDATTPVKPTPMTSFKWLHSVLTKPVKPPVTSCIKSHTGYETTKTGKPNQKNQVPVMQRLGGKLTSELFLKFAYIKIGRIYYQNMSNEYQTSWENKTLIISFSAKHF